MLIISVHYRRLNQNEDRSKRDIVSKMMKKLIWIKSSADGAGQNRIEQNKPEMSRYSSHSANQAA